jgi:hypothetical protein
MPMLLQIQGHHLPGRVWQSRDEHYNNIHVGIQVGKEPHELVRGDAQTSSWTIPIDVLDRDGTLDFRGAAVQGKPGARFVYLTDDCGGPRCARLRPPALSLEQAAS